MRLGTLIPVALLCSSIPASAQEVTIYSTDFSTLQGWTRTLGCDWTAGLHQWRADATPASHPPGPYLSHPASLNFNNGVNIGGSGSGILACGWATSDPIDLTPVAGTARLRFLASWNMEDGCTWDVLTLRILSASSGGELWSECLKANLPALVWHSFDIPLDRSWGQIKIEFGFDAVDTFNNNGSGPFIDDLSVVDAPSPYSTQCPGDGSGTPCPCGNTGASGAGCANSTGHGALLIASGSPSISAGSFALSATHLRPNQFGTYLQGNNSLNGGNGSAFGDGLRCAGGSLVRLQQVVSGPSGSSSTSIDIAAKGGVQPGDTRTYQLWYRDPNISPCNSGFNWTNGIRFTWNP